LVASGKLTPSARVIPRHECIEIAAWPAIGDALKGLGEPGLRINVVHLGCLKECRDRRPGPATTIAACEETVLSRDRLGPDGALNDVAVELDRAVGQEAFEDGATRDCISDCLCELRPARNPRESLLPKAEELIDDSSRCLLTRRDTDVRAVSAGCFFDLLELCHQLYRLGGDLGGVRGVEFAELASAVGPAAGEYHAGIPAVRSVGTIPVNLKNAAMAARMTGDAIASTTVFGPSWLHEVRVAHLGFGYCDLSAEASQPASSTSIQ
jgi:hypothetical protein